MINSKERSKLLALANIINTSVFIGKFGLTEAVLTQLDEMLTDHELIKIGVQKNADFSAKEIIRPICEELNAEPVHAIGNKVIIYRYSTKEGVEHVNYKTVSSGTTEVKVQKTEKPKILGRKTFEYKSTKQHSGKSEDSRKSYRQDNSKQENGKKTYGKTSSGYNSSKSTRSSSDYAPYKKDGVTIYKRKVGKPLSSKKSNKK